MPCNRQAISIRMPTEREHEHNNPEIKSDSAPTNRLAFLDIVSATWEYPMAWLTPTSCWKCTTTRYVITLLALYGIYSVIFS